MPVNNIVLLSLLLAVLLVPFGAVAKKGSAGGKQGEKPAATAPAAATTPATWTDHFAGTSLDAVRWGLVKQHDFQESTIDLVDGRLRLRAATVGTDDTTVKYHGIRTLHPVVDFTAQPAEIAVELDWNQQRNACYMTAGFVLCPTATDGNPLEQPDWIKVEYLGVPPGNNARLQIVYCIEGRPFYLYTEGWPQHRQGREIARQALRLTLSTDRLALVENGTELFTTPYTLFETQSYPPAWSHAYLYLYQTSHSNYRAREIYFDNPTITPYLPPAQEYDSQPAVLNSAME